MSNTSTMDWTVFFKGRKFVVLLPLPWIHRFYLPKRGLALIIHVDHRFIRTTVFYYA